MGMNNRLYACFLLVFLCGLSIVPVAAANAADSGDTGWYVIHCNVEWAKVYLDDKYVGQTSLGTVTVPVPVSSPPKMIRVQKNGYATFQNSITKVPNKGESVDLYTTINLLPETTETAVGGDVGWYVVHCNIEGATVLFDDSNRGEITRGVVYVPIYSTGTPYKKFTVKKDGYMTVVADIPTVPGKGETYDLYATLNPVTPVVTTPVKIGGDTGYYQVHCTVDGATVSFDNVEMGQVTRGNLTVKVYVTGTPYKTFTVSKDGYLPYTSTIERIPAKNETVNLYVTLVAKSGTPSGPTTPAEKSPVSVWICGLSLMAAGAAFWISRK
jgi:hypothetical protein